MDKITNSKIKEAMRWRNERNACNKESQIKQRLGTDIDQIRNKLRSDTTLIRAKLSNDIARVESKETTSGCCFIFLVFCLGIIGLIFYGLFKGFWIGLAVGIAIYFFLKILNTMLTPSKRKLEADAEAEIGRMEAEAEKKIRRLEAEANSEIQNVYDDADRKTLQQINAYDNEVKQYCQRILQKADTITSMVQHNTDMFQRMVSHADAGTNMRFVESDFTFKVLMTGIVYSYQSKYTNPQDDYNFDKQRFRNLNSDTECEGLAQALTKLTIKKMMSLYPPNSLHITVSHIDAEVTMHYRAANKNFVAARDIF